MVTLFTKAPTFADPHGENLLVKGLVGLFEASVPVKSTFGYNVPCWLVRVVERSASGFIQPMGASVSTVGVAGN